MNSGLKHSLVATKCWGSLAVTLLHWFYCCGFPWSWKSLSWAQHASTRNFINIVWSCHDGVVFNAFIHASLGEALTTSHPKGHVYLWLIKSTDSAVRRQSWDWQCAMSSRAIYIFGSFNQPTVLSGKKVGTGRGICDMVCWVWIVASLSQLHSAL